MTSLIARGPRRTTAFSAVVASIIVACSGTAATPTPTRAPTIAPSPTQAATASPTQAATASPTAAATASPTEAATASPTQAVMKPASLRLDWSYLVYHVPFIWGVDKGYYRDEGIDLTISEGQGSGSTVTLIGSKEDTFGFADTGTSLVQTAKGVPVKSVLVIQRRSGFGTACLKAANVSTPKDLEGKSVLLVPQESTAAIWPAYLRVNGVDETKVQIINTDFATKVKLLADERADCMAGYVAQDTLQAQLLNPNVADVLPWVDHGIKLMGHGIVVDNETLTGDPELVRAFIRATIKSWQEVCAKQEEATAFYIGKFPELHGSEADRSFSQQSLPQECPKNEPAEGDTGTAYGPTSDANWQAVIDILDQYGDLDDPQAPSTYYTNEFLPAP